MPGLSSFLSSQRKIPCPFLLSFTLKPHHVAKAVKFFCLLGLAPVFITSSSAFCFQWSPSLPKLGCPGIHSVDPAGPELRDLPALPFQCWDCRCVSLCLDGWGLAEVTLHSLDSIKHQAFLSSFYTSLVPPFLLQLYILYFSLFILLLFIVDLQKTGH